MPTLGRLPNTGFRGIASGQFVHQRGCSPRSLEAETSFGIATENAGRGLSWVIFDRHYVPPVTVSLPQKAEMQEATALLFYLRAEAAAVNAIASGSQHNTMGAINHRSARSLSAAVPI